MVVNFGIDVVYLINIFFMKNTCSNLDTDANTSAAGPLSDNVNSINKQDKAFACGVALSTSALMFVLSLLLMIYCMYIVWSYLRELIDGGSAWHIARLMTWEEQEERDWAKFQERIKHKHEGMIVPPGTYDRVPYASI